MMSETSAVDPIAMFSMALPNPNQAKARDTSAPRTQAETLNTEAVAERARSTAMVTVMRSFCSWAAGIPSRATTGRYPSSTMSLVTLMGTSHSERVIACTTIWTIMTMIAAAVVIVRHLPRTLVNVSITLHLSPRFPLPAVGGETGFHEQ